MKRLCCVAPIACLLLLPSVGDACADGVYDGEWKGSATSNTRRCKPASLTLSDSDKDKFVGRYVTCTPRFCRSEIDLPASLTKLPANLDKAAIHFHIPGKMVVVPMQSDGMVAAFDAVFKKAKG